MSDKFRDPSNAQDIIKKLTTFRTLGDVKTFVDGLFPGFIKCTMNGYSKDYPSLTSNWHLVCEDSKVKPALIVIVENLYFDDNHTVLMSISEIFTKAGFAIRRYGEFNSCSTCGLAVPTRTIYDKLVSNSVETPEYWSNKCKRC
jgi:hypothetical protein